MIAVAKPAVYTANEAAVLTKAVARAAERMGISRSLLAKVLGVSPSTIASLYAGDYKLEQNRKEWELALLFVRAFRSLNSLVGEESAVRKWLNSENLGLHGRPIELVSQTEGLVRVVHHLDAALAMDPSPDSENVLRLLELDGMAAETFATEAGASAWLSRPHPMLGGETPLAAAKTSFGAQRVKGILLAIKYGGVV